MKRTSNPDYDTHEEFEMDHPGSRKITLPRPVIAHGTPEWHAARALRIGASEIGAVLGKDDYCSPVQLFMRKRMAIRRVVADDHRAWGSDMEPAILRNFARRNGYELLPAPGLVLAAKLPHLCATPDGLGVKGGRVRNIQAKNVEEHHTREWGEPGTSKVPLLYYAQVTIELGLLKEAGDATPLDDETDIAVSFGGRPPLGYPIPFDAALFGEMSEAAARFVRDYLVPDKVPPLAGDVAALEYVKARWAKTTGELLAPTTEAKLLVGRLRVLKAEGKQREKEMEALQAELCAMIGPAYGFESLCAWAEIPESRKLVTDWPLVLEQVIGLAALKGVQLDRDDVRGLIDGFTHEEVTRESYRRLTLAKEKP